MKKILASIIISLSLLAYAQAAIGIPENLQPKNRALKDLNKVITQEVAENGQEGAISAMNIVLQYGANLLLYFAAPLAVLFITIAGATYASAMGEESRMEGAKRQLTWSIIGLIAIMFAYIIIRFIIQPTIQLDEATKSSEVLQKNEEQLGEKMISPESKEKYCQKVYKMSCKEYEQKNSSEYLNKEAKKKVEEEKRKTDEEYIRLTKEQEEKAAAEIKKLEEAAKKETTYEKYDPVEDGFGSRLKYSSK